MFFLGLAFSPLSYGQSVAEDTLNQKFKNNIQWDTTLTTNANFLANKTKSVWLAIGASFLMPGLGHIYLQNPGFLRYIISDIVLWSVVGISILAQQQYLQNTYSLASKYGGIHTQNQTILQSMTEYRAYQHKENRNDSYEYALNLQGKNQSEYPIAYTSENFWDFGPSSSATNNQNWQLFKNTYQNYQSSKNITYWFVGGLVMHRVITTLQTLFLYKNSNNSLAISFNTLVNPQKIHAITTISF